MSMQMIDFFKMSGCYFCDEAEKLLKQFIQDGIIVVKTAEQCQKAGHRPSGFPFFHSSSTGKSHTGLPKSFQALCDSLGLDLAQHKQHAQSPHPQAGADVECRVWVMEGCPWCTRLLGEIQPLVEAGVCVIHKHNDPSHPPPAGVRGFPYAQNKNGKSVNGFKPYAEFVASLEIAEPHKESYPMGQLQQAIAHDRYAQESIRENFVQQTSVPTLSATQLQAANQANIREHATNCASYKDESSCSGSTGHTKCHWNEASRKCGLHPEATSEVLDCRRCVPGNCPPIKEVVPPVYNEFMLPNGQVSWEMDWALVGPDAFTMLAFSGCESDGTSAGGCKSGYSMFGVM